MTYLIGTDEAGYGPNLGPLVISATVWEVPEGVRSEDLYGRLGDAIAASPSGAAAGRGQGGRGPRRVVMADSKALYQSGKGLAALERGLLAALTVLGPRPTRWEDVWQVLAPESAPARRAEAWYADFDRPVPLEADPADLESLGGILQQGLDEGGVRLMAIRSRAIFEEEFNQLLERHGSKGTVLSRATLELIAGLLEPLAEGPIAVLCDKHGGRNSYGGLLGERFPQSFLEIHGESRQRSVYRFGPPGRRVEIRFLCRAESHLPAALASMASKYLRELAMLALNEFWCRRLPGLRATAGYPGDARRFKSAIAALQKELGIGDQRLWRRR